MATSASREFEAQLTNLLPKMSTWALALTKKQILERRCLVAFRRNVGQCGNQRRPVQASDAVDQAFRDKGRGGSHRR